VRHQRGRDRLPPHGLALLAQPDQALLRIEIGRPQCEGSAAPTSGLGVQAQEQGVEGWVVAGGRGDLVDLRHAGFGHGLARGG
jgi:hypothetical protein